MALLFTLWPGDVSPRQEVPAPIPMADCLELAGRVALYYDKTMWQGQPKVYCEVTEL